MSRLLTETYPIARRSERISVGIPLKLLVESQGRKVEQDARTVDFSQLGVRVQSRAVLTPGQTVEIIPNEEPRYLLPSRVVWVGKAGSQRYTQAGLEFLCPLPSPT